MQHSQSWKCQYLARPHADSWDEEHADGGIGESPSNTNLELDDLVSTRLRQEQRERKSAITLEWNMIGKWSNFELKLPIPKEYHKELYYDKTERILTPLHPYPEGSIQF